MPQKVAEAERASVGQKEVIAALAGKAGIGNRQTGFASRPGKVHPDELPLWPRRARVGIRGGQGLARIETDFPVGKTRMGCCRPGMICLEWIVRQQTLVNGDDGRRARGCKETRQR